MLHLMYFVFFKNVFPVSKMLGEGRQTGSRFSQKISADWHQLWSHSASLFSQQNLFI